MARRQLEEVPSIDNILDQLFREYVVEGNGNRASHESAVDAHTIPFLDLESENSENSYSCASSGVGNTSRNGNPVQSQAQLSAINETDDVTVADEPLGPGQSDLVHVHGGGDVSSQILKMNAHISSTDQPDHGGSERYNNTIKDIVKEIETEAELLQRNKDAGNQDGLRFIDLNDTHASVTVSSKALPDRLLSTSAIQRVLQLTNEHLDSGMVSAGEPSVNNQMTNSGCQGSVGQTSVHSDPNRDDVASQVNPLPCTPDVSHLVPGVTIPDCSATHISTEPYRVQNPPELHRVVDPRDKEGGRVAFNEDVEGEERDGLSPITLPVASKLCDTHSRMKRIRSMRARETLDSDSPEYKLYLKGLNQDARKRELNRQAAKRCRDKKFNVEIELEQRAKRLRKQRDQLIAEKSRLVSETSTISSRLNSHDHCLMRRQVSN